MTPREYLFSLEYHGIKLGLDNIRRLLDAADNPHRRYPAAHVAGTNGKGSVAAMTDAMVRAAGYKSGRFTSPHLIDLRERFLVGAEPIPDDVLDEEIAFFRDVAGQMEMQATFFEFTTAIAFRWFERCGVDVAMIEVGMGGRFDSTNVIQPAATAITNIELEHTEYLGNTVKEIAREKAGIVKPDTPLVLSETRPEARDVILARAEECGSPVYMRGRDFDYDVTGGCLDMQFRYRSATLDTGSVPLALAGDYQGGNAATATALAERLAVKFPRIDKRAIVTGLNTARWPCRLERVLESPPVLLDVAHNVAGVRHLARQLSQCIVVMAVSKDKDAAGMIAALTPIAHTLILSRFAGDRSFSVDALCEAAGEHPHLRAPGLVRAIEMGLDLASDATPLLIAGSIFMAGEARQILIERHGAPPLRF